MRWVVFLRAINVGGANRCRPTQIAEQLAKFRVVNIGAVGTFVVREEVSDSVLRAALARKLPFKSEIMICPAKAVLDLMRRDPFANQPSGPDVVRFVNVLAKPLHSSLVTEHSSLSLPSYDDWLLKIIAIQGRFVLGLYRRQMKAISCLGKLEKLLGVPATTRESCEGSFAKLIAVIVDRFANSAQANTRSMAGMRRQVRCTALCSLKSLAP